MSAAQDALRPAVTGYVEAMTATAALGWAWMPGSTAPLPVELRLGPDLIAEAVADQPREDLQRSGIGEGHHAFRLPVPETVRARLQELRVVARTPDGGSIPLNRPPVEDGVSERLAQLARGMEVLVGSQRVLHRNVQAALLAGPGGIEPQAGTSTTQAALADGFATLELFVVRLEQALSGMAPPPAPAQPRWVLATVAFVAAMALVASVVALIHVMPA